MAEQEESLREISSLLKTQNTMLAHLGIIVTRLTWMVLALLLIVIVLMLVGLFG